jgi:short-subunit dehydrogenase
VCPGFVNTGIAKATRYVGTSDTDQEQLRDRADRAYRRRNLKPEAVAAAVLRAVEHNEAVVAVGTEAKLGELVSRALPGLARRFAGLDMPWSGRSKKE